MGCSDVVSSLCLVGTWVFVVVDVSVFSGLDVRGYVGAGTD